MRRALVFLILLAGCGGDSPTAPLPNANIVTEGTGNFVWQQGNCSGLAGGCLFTAEARNLGPGCAVAVRGITRLYQTQAQLDAGTQLASAEWSLDSARKLVVGEAFKYSGRFPQSVRDVGPERFRTEFFWTNVRC